MLEVVAGKVAQTFKLFTQDLVGLDQFLSPYR